MESALKYSPDPENPAVVFNNLVDYFISLPLGLGFERDFQTDMLSLDCAFLRLTRWAQAVNIYEDPKLGKPDATPAEVKTAVDILIEMRGLFINKRHILGDDTPALLSYDMNPTAIAVHDKMKRLAMRQRKYTDVIETRAFFHQRSELQDCIRCIALGMDQIDKLFSAPQSFALVKQETAEIQDQQELDLVKIAARGVDPLLEKAVTEALTGHQHLGFVSKPRAQIGNMVGNDRKGEVSGESHEYDGGDVDMHGVKVARDVLQLSPYQPGDEEKTFYYFGLPSQPKFVARSSGFRWQRRFEDQHEIRKVLKNVGRHPIVDQYNDNVMKDIVDALGDLQWNAVDVLRIGYNFDGPTKHPVILWVSVQPGSTTWEKGSECAAKCIAVLRQHNITDVECEVREAFLLNLAGPRRTILGVEDTCDEEHLPFTQTLGQSLARINDSSCEGSMGLYLKRNDSKKYYGLTCRHCIWPKENEEDNILYRKNSKVNSQPLIKVIQPGESTFRSLKEENDKYVDFWSNPTKHRQDDAKAANALKPLKEKRSFLNSFTSLSDRVIGHVAFSPKRELHRGGWLRDWALIELWEENFSGDAPTNQVYIGEVPKKILKVLNADPPGFHFKMENRKSLKLRGIIPVDEMKKPTMKDENGEECLLVGKRGRSSSVTWGMANELISLTRSDCAGQTIVSKEWCVPSSIKEAFSEDGDSGSAVFDVMGRMGGILNAGTGRSLRIDTTYVTPMEWLLSDIQEYLPELSIV